MALPIENRQIAYLHLVRFNNSYGIRDFCDDRALNSLHFLTGTSAGFLRTALAGSGRQKAPPDAYSSSSPMKAHGLVAIPRKGDTGQGPIHRNGARPIPRIFGETDDGGAGSIAPHGRSSRSKKTTRHIVEVTRPLAVASCAECAPSGRPPCGLQHQSVGLVLGLGQWRRLQRSLR